MEICIVRTIKSILSSATSHYHRESIMHLQNQYIPIRQPTPLLDPITYHISYLVKSILLDITRPSSHPKHSLISALYLMITLHRFSIGWWYCTPTASLPGATAIIVPGSILVLVHRRGHGSRCAISINLSGSCRVLWHSSLAAVGGLNDHICDAAVLGVLGELIVVCLGVFGDDIWRELASFLEEERGGTYTRRARGRE